MLYAFYPARPNCPFPQSWPRGDFLPATYCKHARGYPATIFRIFHFDGNLSATNPQTYPRPPRNHFRSAGNLPAINPQTYPRPARNHLLFCRKLTRKLTRGHPEKIFNTGENLPAASIFSPRKLIRKFLCCFALVSPYNHYLVLLAHCTFRSCYRRFNFRQ